MSYELWGVSSYRDYYFQGLALFRENNEGLMLKISALESLCIGQCTLSTQLMKPNYIFSMSVVFDLLLEDNELVRIILVKSSRDAASGWKSLLVSEYSADPWTFNEMEKKLTLERFQKEVTSVLISFNQIKIEGPNNRGQNDLFCYFPTESWI